MIVYAYPADKYGCGHYRLIWVCEVLRAQGHDVRTIIPKDRTSDVGLNGMQDAAGNLVSVTIPEDADVMVFQRVTLGQLAQAIPMIRAKGVAVVVDIDDDLTSAHPANQAWQMMHPKWGRPGHSWHNHSAACRDATMVTVSTPALLRVYGQHGRGRVLENCVPERYLSVPHEDSDVVGWGGVVASHPEDLQVVGQGVARHVRAGGRFRHIGEAGGVRDALGLDQDPDCAGYVDLEKWPAALATLGVGLAPLADSRFNQSKCVDSSMRITTSRGVVPAGEVEPGMSVWHDRWRMVEAVEHGQPQPGILLTTMDGYQLRLTPEHRMLVNGDWVRAKDIVVGNVMSMEPESVGPVSSLRVPWPADSRMGKSGTTFDPHAFLTASDGPRIDLTPRWGRFLGAFVGDGCSGQSTQLEISCDGQDQDWIDLLIDDLRAFGFNPTTQAITTYGGKVLRRRGVRVASAHLLRVLESLGLTQPRPNGRPIRVPCVPEVIWRSPREVIAEFLAGYFEADGTCWGTMVTAVSKDEKLIRDVQRLLLLFGVMSRVRPVVGHAQNGFVGSYWRISLRRASTDVFAKEIGFRSSRKNGRLAIIVGRKHSNAYRPMTWEQEVALIEQCPIDPVDIQVEGSVYIAAGFVSHNSHLKPLEYSALGVPWVASPRAEYRRFHRAHPGTGLLAEKPREWYRQITALTGDGARRRDMSAAGRVAAAGRTIEGNAWRWWNAWEEAWLLQRQAAVSVFTR